jgi:DNA polymerase III epsilon subunit-like protein
MAIMTIDFEASCLPRHGRSYPIEVGIADMSGKSRSWLIRPHRSWDGWDWTEEAERLHGISYSQLLRDGLPANEVASSLCKALIGHRVIADSSIDNYWLQTLIAASRVSIPVKFEHIDKVLDELGATTQEIMESQLILARKGFRRHRAGEDARWMLALIEMLTKKSNQHTGSAEARDFQSSVHPDIHMHVSWGRAVTA